jgi:hypothetical protein
VLERVKQILRRRMWVGSRGVRDHAQGRQHRRVGSPVHRWPRTFSEQARRHDREPRSRANATAVPYAASEARSQSRRRLLGTARVA